MGVGGGSSSKQYSGPVWLPGAKQLGGKVVEWAGPLFFNPSLMQSSPQMKALMASGLASGEREAQKELTKVLETPGTSAVSRQQALSSIPRAQVETAVSLPFQTWKDVISAYISQLITPAATRSSGKSSSGGGFRIL